jgi:parallel beta-helix repeat protein
VRASTERVPAALLALLVACCTLATAIDSAHGVDTPPRGTALRPIAAKRIALTGALLSASERTRTAGREAIVDQSFANGLKALVVTRDVTLLDLRRSSPETVVELRPGVWELRRTIFVARGATLSIEAPAVRELRLLSRPGRFASIIARSANLEFHGLPDRRLLVRSWNPLAGHPDRVLRDGRATVAVRGQGRLDASDATFARLGFYRGTVSGFALWARGKSHGTGTVRHSRFVNNYNGAYSFGARGMRWINNRFVHNRVYGFDPHTGSSNFLVRGNYAARNGRHGIIFSLDCDHNVISRNVSEHNRWHGIVLDDGKHGNGPSNFNVVTDNVVRDNANVGIQIDGSAHNLIRGNRIVGSRHGVRILGPAKDNVIARNSVAKARDFGVILYFPSRRTVVADNRISDTPTGLRIHGSSFVSVSENRIERVVSHAVKVDEAARGEITGIVIAGNRMQGSGTSPVRISTRGKHAVERRENQISWNYPLMHDVTVMLRSRVGPGLWLLLFFIAFAGPLFVACVQRLPPGRRSRAGV